MAQILITGGAGFIGSHLVDRLLAEAWRVTVVDNFDAHYDRAVKYSNIAAHQESPGYTLVEADIRDLPGLRQRLSGGYDAIVHLAAKVGVRPSLQEPASYEEVNIRGTQNMLELAKEWGVKQFVFGSSSSVYGLNPNVPWRENDSVLLPISPYALTKVSGELMGHVYSHLYGIRYIALRFFTVYGPRQRPDLAIHKFARQMLDGCTVPLFGDGSDGRDYTYIGDIINGIRAAISYDRSLYEVINLGSNSIISLSEVIRTLEELTRVTARIVRLPRQLGDVPRTCADVGKAARLLGYEPATDFRAGLSAFVDWLKVLWLDCNRTHSD